MSAMMAALKSKRMGDAAPKGMLQEEPEAPKTDLKSLVASLSDDEKQELMGMLSGSDGKSDASAIAKGAPSDQEREKISAKIADEDSDGPLEDPSDETDEIGMSMLSSADKAQAGVERPARSLGDRVRMNMAAKLKAKGKL